MRSILCITGGERCNQDNKQKGGGKTTGHRIQFVLTDEQYKTFMKDVEDSGVSISQYVISKVLPDKTDFEKLWDEFKEKLEIFPVGIDFDVSIVMGQDKWYTLDKSQKLSVARLFNKKVSSGEYSNITMIGRSSSNVSRYRKIT